MKGKDLEENEEFPIHRVDQLNWILFIFLSILTWFFAPVFIAKSVFIGGFLANISYLFLKKDLKNFLQGKLLLSGKIQTAKNQFYLKYYMRLGALALILFFLVSKHIAHPLGLLIGLSVVVFSIGITMMSVVRKFFFKPALF